MLHVVSEVFLWLLGLCVGSFLNVVVYRLPAGLSVAKPPRSFCPRCEHAIAWYDNVPVLSWLVLRGRCRRCEQPISPQYPLVEALTGLAFVLVYHLLMVAPARAGLDDAALPGDAALLVAWLILTAGLIACAGMDISSYMVDTRVTNLVVVAGIVLYASWPRQEFFLPRAASPAGAAAVAAFIIGTVVLWWTVWRLPDDGNEPPGQDEAPREDPAVDAHQGLLGGIVAAVVLVLLTGLLVAGAAGMKGLPPARVMVGLALTAGFFATVIAGGQRRSADDELAAALEDEEPQARRTALHELLRLCLPLAAAAVVYTLVDGLPAPEAAWQRATAWPTDSAFAPLGGAAFAIHGAVVAAAAGWGLRIVFTLAFGREAFGVGDIYILAAAGAVAGWDIALLGLLLAVGIALAGWLLGLLLKSTTMIPFGPWLALGFVVALWCSRPAERIALSYQDNLLYAWREQPHILMVVAGLMLVGTAAAIAFSRLLRGWLTSREETAGE